MNKYEKDNLYYALHYGRCVGFLKGLSNGFWSKEEMIQQIKEFLKRQEVSDE